MTTREQALTKVIRNVRGCFNLLKRLSEQLNEDLGINPSMRAVMESLFRHSPQTVPEIARERGVTRQHVQMIMNSLLEDRLVESRSNPAHRRSVLYCLTAEGLTAFEEIMRREAEPMRRIAAAMPAEEWESVAAALEIVSRRIGAELDPVGPE